MSDLHAQLSARTVTGSEKKKLQDISLNSSILETAAAIIGVRDHPLTLVLSSVIDTINHQLSLQLDVNSIRKSADTGRAITPEETAERIASLTSETFIVYEEQHPDENIAVVLSKFIQSIRSVIERGFAEARDILQGLDVLEGEIASDIEQTFSLVQEKLAAFEAMVTDFNAIPGTQQG